MNTEKRENKNNAFWQGYRAFVFGGRKFKNLSRKEFKVVDTSIEPFDYLSKEEKTEWQKGVKFAQKERAECRALLKPRIKSKKQLFSKDGNSAWIMCQKLGISYTKIHFRMKRYGVSFEQAIAMIN